jgi:sulfite exporter TauE/SafE
VAAALLVAFAASLAGLVRPIHLWIPRVAAMSSVSLRHNGPAWRFALGTCAGLIPCGLVHAALAVPVAAASPATGALAMVVFGAGTIPALALAAGGLRRTLTGSLLRRRILAAGVLIAGLGALAARIPAENGEPTCHAP